MYCASGQSLINVFVHAFVCVCLCVCVCVCVRACVCFLVHACAGNLYIHSHFRDSLMAGSSLLILMNTATATTPAMAPVSRTPPMKAPMAAPTPVLEHAQPVWG